MDPAAFRDVLTAMRGDRNPAIGSADAAFLSAGALDATDSFSEPAKDAPVASRASAKLPATSSAWGWQTPKQTMTGIASFYDNGTTAMRLPRGTIIVICGAAGCLERVVRDYGPAAWTNRIVDMYRPDFFKICGCRSTAGTTKVTIFIY